MVLSESYNPSEHNHIEWSKDKLNEKLAVLALSREYGVGPRRQQIEREMGYIAFELSEQLREQRDEEIEAAWALHQSE